MPHVPSQTAINEKVIGKLNELIALDFDAIEAYQAAIDRLEDSGARAKLQEFMRDHERHTRNLSELVRQHGGRPRTGPDAKRFLTKGKVVMANLAGDRAIMNAMRSNEDVTNHKYETALEMQGLDVPTRGVLETNLADERRHREWIQSWLDGSR